MKFDTSKLDPQYVSKKKHPTEDLYILSYTKKAQIEWHWDKDTIVCRGMIVDSDDNIVSRPFTKFFTPEQYQRLDSNEIEIEGYVEKLYGVKYKNLYDGPFVCTEKMDGSLGISYFNSDGSMSMATKGSFESDQAEMANRILEKMPFDIDLRKEYTYLFEICSPNNQIVVNYPHEELVLLGVIETETGRELSRFEVIDMNLPFPMTTKWVIFHSFEEIMQDKEKHGEFQNREGYVVHFTDSGIRVKIKFDEYLRLHKIMTNCSDKRIWEAVRDEEMDGIKTFDVMLKNTSEEFSESVRKVREELYKIHRGILQSCWLDVLDCLKKKTRKEQAKLIKNRRYSPIVFAMLDGKDDAEQIRLKGWNYVWEAYMRGYCGFDMKDKQ